MDRHLEIFVLTTNQDHDGEVLDIQADQWVPYGEKAKVMYLAAGSRGYKNIQNAIDHVRPDTVYFNGMYSIPLLVFPLQILKKRKEVKIVIAPRGMLQEGALKIKPTKKRIFLRFFKLVFRPLPFFWHATDEQEQLDIQRQFKNSTVLQVGNIPQFAKAITKSRRPEIQFVSISLLARKKNHILFLKALKSLKTSRVVTYHIYGPISDQEYYKELTEEMAGMPENVHVDYKGTLRPEEVSRILVGHQYFVLTSSGENFGHSIFEAFNQGVPVIISDQTPWKRLKEKQAGWDVDLKHPEALIKAIEEAIHLDDVSYLALRKGARKVAEQYMEANDFGADYLKLFSR
jgi:glycosyltransferase involved in cell wall biosynthesis